MFLNVDSSFLSLNATSPYIKMTLCSRLKRETSFCCEKMGYPRFFIARIPRINPGFEEERASERLPLIPSFISVERVKMDKLLFPIHIYEHSVPMNFLIEVVDHFRISRWSSSQLDYQMALVRESSRGFRTFSSTFRFRNSQFYYLFFFFLFAIALAISFFQIWYGDRLPMLIKFLLGFGDLDQFYWFLKT